MYLCESIRFDVEFPACTRECELVLRESNSSSLRRSIDLGMMLTQVRGVTEQSCSNMTSAAVANALKMGSAEAEVRSD